MSRARRRREAPMPAVPLPGPAARGFEVALLVALGLVLLARALAGATTSGWAWGLNTFRDWPSPWPIGLPLLAAIAFVPALQRRAGGTLDAWGDRMAAGGAVARALLAAAVGLVAFALPDPLRFTGDALTRLALAAPGADVAAVTPQMAPLDQLVNVHGVRALLGLGVPRRWALQAIGGLTAFAFALVVLAFLRALELRGRAWLAAAALLLGSGCLVHLAGYAKQGPLLVGLALAATGLVRLARQGRGAWTLAAGMALALLGHRAAYAVLPAVAWAYAAALRGATRGRRARVAVPAALLGALALALLPHAAHVLLGYDRRVNLPGIAGAGVGPWRRLADAANALLFLSPACPIALVAAWGARAGGAKADAARAGRAPSVALPLGWIAALAFAGELVVMLVVRGRQGYARDWDNQVGPALVLTLLTAGLLATAWRRHGAARTALPVCAVALVSGLALWGIQASRPVGEARVRTLLADSTAWTAEEWGLAHDFVGQRAFEAERYLEAARAYEIAAARVPTPRLLDNVAVAYAMAGREAEARAALARAMAVPQSSPTMWAALARVGEFLGDTARARVCMDSAQARLSPVGAGSSLPGGRWP